MNTEEFLNYGLYPFLACFAVICLYYIGINLEKIANKK